MKRASLHGGELRDAYIYEYMCAHNCVRVYLPFMHALGTVPLILVEDMPFIHTPPCIYMCPARCHRPRPWPLRPITPPLYTAAIAAALLAQA